MKIIPAIDIIGRKVVRLEQGKFHKEKVYSSDPVKVAKEWKDLGAELLHIVDLDGARLGKPMNMGVAQDIIKKVGIDVELGGGLRSERDIRRAFRSGVSYAVVGTSAVHDALFCKSLTRKFGDRIIFAVDAKGGKVAIRGWEKVSTQYSAVYMKKLESLGVRKIIYTDISRDGMMKGPNLEALKAILRTTSLEVVASGGISNIEDIKALKSLEGEGLTGIIVGKALYEGKLDLKEAINAG